MVSEAQKRACRRYRQRSTKTKSVTFFKQDLDLVDWLEKQPSQAAYIRDLIRQDMEKKQGSSGQ